MKSRRDFLARAMGLSAGLAAAPRLLAAEKSTASKDTHARSAASGRNNVLVETPDVPQLPWRVVDGAKEFHLVAEPVKRRLIPGREMQVWGYNGSCPGPTIQVNQGDRVRVVFEENSGITYAHTVDCIDEAIAEAERRFPLIEQIP